MINKNSAHFFQNKNCPYFPCHNGIKEENFNCMFCYCPLYTLGNNCGGNFTVLPNNIKDCSNCTVCHSPYFAKTVEQKFNLITKAEISQRK